MKHERRGMKRTALAGGLIVAVLVAVAVTALAAGYGRTFTMGASGVVAVTNSQANSVWRPVILAVRCGDTASRTVTVSRVVGGMEYPIARTTGSGQTYVYEFDGVYWFSLSNVLQVAVEPACTGIVEVIYE